MADAVQALVQEVKEKKEQTRAEKAMVEQRRRRKQRTRLVQLAALALALVAALIYAIPRWKQPLARPTGAAARDDARHTILFAARLLDQYQLRAGRLPGSFRQTGVELPTLQYQPTGDSYALTIDVDGQAITFHKGDDPVRFLSSH